MMNEEQKRIYNYYKGLIISGYYAGLREVEGENYVNTNDCDEEDEYGND